MVPQVVTTIGSAISVSVYWSWRVALGRDRDTAASPVARECAPTAFYLPKRARRPGQLAATMTASDSAISAHAQPAWSGWLQAIITPCENQNRARTPAQNADFTATVPPRSTPASASSGGRANTTSAERRGPTTRSEERRAEKE